MRFGDYSFTLSRRSVKTEFYVPCEAHFEYPSGQTTAKIRTFTLNYAATNKNRTKTLGTSSESWWSEVYAKFLALIWDTCKCHFHLIFWLLKFLKCDSIIQMSLLSCRALICKLSEAHKLYDFDFKKHFQAPDFFWLYKETWKNKKKFFWSPTAKRSTNLALFFNTST